MSDLQSTPPDQESNDPHDPPKNGVSIFGKSFSVGALAAWISIFGLLALLAFGLLRNQEGPVTVGEVVPNFTLTTFEGEQISLEELKDKVVVLKFLALSWCKTLANRRPAELETAWRLYQPGGEVIFLGVVDYVDTETEAKAYLEKFDVTYPNGPDLRTKISQAFRIRGCARNIYHWQGWKTSSFQDLPLHFSG